MEKLNLRKANIDDIDDIVSLWQDLNKDQLSKDPYYKGDLTFNGGSEQFTAALSDERCSIYVGEAGGEIVGFIETWIQNPDFYFFSDEYAYILHFFIKDGHRNHRAAHNFYKIAEDWSVSKGKRYLAADVFDHNQKVVKLLEFMGLRKYRYRLVKELGEEKGHE